MRMNWAEITIDGRRINRIIRYLETKLKKCTDDDKIIRYANSIAFLTGKKLEIADRVLGIHQILKSGQKDYNLNHDKPLDPSNKYKLANEF